MLFLLGSLLGVNGFTPSSVTSKVRVSRTKYQTNKPIRSIGTSLFSDHQDSIGFVKKERKKIIKKIDNSVGKMTRDKAPLSWIGVLMLLMSAESLVGNPNLPTGLSSPKHFVYSTVSATLLRRSSPKWNFLGPVTFPSLFVAFQLLQTGSILKAASVGFSNFSSWYMGCLVAFPLYTKALTTALIGISGDTTAQYLEERIRASDAGSKINLKNYDRRRGLSKFADSLLITGPLLHFAYDWLENLIPIASVMGSPLSASLAAFSQVLIDDFVFDAIFVAIMFISTGIGEGYTKQLIPQFKKDFVPAVKTSWKTSIFLMPLEFCLFRFLPLSLRVLGMNIIDIIWEAMVSYMIHRRRKGAMDTETAITAEVAVA